MQRHRDQEFLRYLNTIERAVPRQGDGSIAAANRFLAEAFVADHKARFAVTAAEPGSAFVPYAGDLAEVLCVQVERVVGNDNCVRYEGQCLQIPPHRHRHHFVKVKVRVHAYEDGRLAVFHGPRCLAATPDGHLADVEATVNPPPEPARRPTAATGHLYVLLTGRDARRPLCESQHQRVTPCYPLLSLRQS
jgi:hypothetical protein